jgi:hypothetical protein
MKNRLLHIFMLMSLMGYAQNPITTYSSTASTNFAIVTSSSAIDQTAAGANIIWNFNTLTAIGNSVDTYATPTATELTSYPTTTSVATITSTVGSTNTISKLYTKNVSNAVSITAVKATDLELNYVTNNALLGTFPLSYGYTNTDVTAGTYVYTTYSGTFSGTINTSVDAYGLLSTNIPGIVPGTPVTRLKTEQNINLNYSFFTNVGTITQTSYGYYGAGNLLFRSTTVVVNVPLLSINQTSTQFESFTTILLGIENQNLQANLFRIAPNPVKEFLNIALSNNEIINVLTISDCTGKTILKVNHPEKSIPIGHLQKGIYRVAMTSEKGTQTEKFIKE